jgi:hypothetical protein
MSANFLHPLSNARVSPNREDGEGSLKKSTKVTKNSQNVFPSFVDVM